MHLSIYMYTFIYLLFESAMHGDSVSLAGPWIDCSPGAIGFDFLPFEGSMPTPAVVVGLLLDCLVPSYLITHMIYNQLLDLLYFWDLRSKKSICLILLASHSLCWHS